MPGNERLELTLTSLLAKSNENSVQRTIPAESIGIKFHDKPRVCIVVKYDTELRVSSAKTTQILEYIQKVETIIAARDPDAKYTYFIVDITHLGLTS